MLQIQLARRDKARHDAIYQNHPTLLIVLVCKYHKTQNEGLVGDSTASRFLAYCGGCNTANNPVSFLSSSRDVGDDDGVRVDEIQRKIDSARRQSKKN